MGRGAVEINGETLDNSDNDVEAKCGNFTYRVFHIPSGGCTHDDPAAETPVGMAYSIQVVRKDYLDKRLNHYQMMADKREAKREAVKTANRGGKS